MFTVMKPFRVGKYWTTSVRFANGAIVWMLPSFDRNVVIREAHKLARI